MNIKFRREKNQKDQMDKCERLLNVLKSVFDITFKSDSVVILDDKEKIYPRLYLTCIHHTYLKRYFNNNQIREDTMDTIKLYRKDSDTSWKFLVYLSSMNKLFGMNKEKVRELFDYLTIELDINTNQITVSTEDQESNNMFLEYHDNGCYMTPKYFSVRVDNLNPVLLQSIKYKKILMDTALELFTASFEDITEKANKRFMDSLS